MVYTEDLMILLYDEALESGMELEMVDSLAKSNKMSEEEVLEILIRNGCDVEKIMKKRGRPPKNTNVQPIEKPVARLAPSTPEPVASSVANSSNQAEPVASPVANSSSQTEPRTPMIPDIVYDIVADKIALNAKLIDEFEEKLSLLEKEQKQLTEFIKHRCS